MPTSIFAARRDLVYERYAVGLHVTNIVGGVPSNPKVIEGWLRTNLGEATDEQIQRQVRQTMEERGVGADEAAEVVAAESKLNGFKRDADGLYSEGRHVKALVKEASNVAWPKRKWGPSNKGTRSWWSEHVFVEENRIHHGREKPDEVQQRFVTTWRGTSFVYEEVDHEVDLAFHLLVDGSEAISDDDWAALWLRAEQIGLGAVRSQSFGRFVVTRFEKV